MIFDESRLIQRILTRDRRALLQFYRAYTPRLTAHIRAKIDSPADADEILSDTLYAFLEALRDFTGRSSIDTFIFAICNHKIIDFYRRKKLKHMVFSRLPQLEALVSPILSPEDVYESRQLAQKVKKTFDRILPQYRRALILKYAENLSVSEISKKLAVTVKSAESVLFRARKAFVKAFISI